jgi:curved DNA-binding protein CbpA
MNVNQAMNVLNLTGSVTQKDIKKAYKLASIKYHPDKNPAGAEMMKIINNAFELLSKLGEQVEMGQNAESYDYGEIINQVLNQLVTLEGITIEICGNWVWVGGETKPHAKRLGRKEGGIGCIFSKKKAMWYYRPKEYKSSSRRSHSMEEIRELHGSTTINAKGPKRLAA